MLQKIYNYSPIFFQNIMVSVKGKQFEKERYNKEYYKELNYLRSLEDEFEVQEKRFNKFIQYIKNNSPFYKNKLDHLSGTTVTLNDLTKIPMINKEIIRNNVETIVTRKKTYLNH